MSFLWQRRNRIDAVLRKGLHSAVGQESSFRRVRTRNGINSIQIHYADPGESRQDLFVKLIRHRRAWRVTPPEELLPLPSEVARSQNAFRGVASDAIRVPRVLYYDDASGVLVFEYVHGKNLKEVLRGRNAEIEIDLPRTGRLAGEALATWHSLWGTSDPTDNREEERQVRIFNDFAVWNILVDDRVPAIYLVDFPGNQLFGRLHRDLASMLHSLLVTRYHPRVRFLARPKWRWQDFFKSFLEGYGEEANICLSEHDFDLTRQDLRTIILKEITKYRSTRSTLRGRLEVAYYSRLLENSIFAKEFNWDRVRL